MNCEGTKQTPWKNGYYRMKGAPFVLFMVDGENVTMEGISGRVTNHDQVTYYKGKWIYGDFGEANSDLSKETGETRYNVDIKLYGGAMGMKGILNMDGTKITVWGWANSVDCFEWESDESISNVRKTGDPFDSPVSHYEIRPEYQGKLLFITGAPGLGKSTTAQLLSRKEGYVYYEGDCFWFILNPYIPSDVKEPSLAMMKQNFLSGVPQARIDDCGTAEAEFTKMMEGKESEPAKFRKLYTLMAEDVLRERKRIGGDWAVAQAVPTRELRDYIRGIIGAELIFVVLHMSKEDQEARVKNRHGDEEGATDYLVNAYKLFEPAAQDEPNTLDVRISPEMTPEDVADRIVAMLKNI